MSAFSSFLALRRGLCLAHASLVILAILAVFFFFHFLCLLFFCFSIYLDLVMLWLFAYFLPLAFHFWLEAFHVDVHHVEVAKLQLVLGQFELELYVEYVNAFCF